MCPHGLDFWHLILDTIWLWVIAGGVLLHSVKSYCYCVFCKLFKVRGKK